MGRGLWESSGDGVCVGVDEILDELSPSSPSVPPVPSFSPVSPPSDNSEGEGLDVKIGESIGDELSGTAPPSPTKDGAALGAGETEDTKELDASMIVSSLSVNALITATLLNSKSTFAKNIFMSTVIGVGSGLGESDVSTD